jgi:hypothetical protein
MQLKWGEGSLIKVEGIGTRIVQTAVGDAMNTLTIANVYYVPGFINILSYIRMRDKGMLFENDGKQPKLRFKNKDNTVAYVNMPAKGEKGLPSLLLRDVVIDETLTTQDDPGEYELVAPNPQEYLLSPIVPLEGEGELEDISVTPLDDPGEYELVAPGPLSPIVPLKGEEKLEDTSAISRDDSDKDTYEDPQEFEPSPPAAAPIVPARPQRSTANKPLTRYENELAKQKTLHKYMHKIGFVPFPANPYLFTIGTITIAVWIDDMLACGPDEKELDRVYETKDLGAPAHFLGIEVTRDSNVTKVRQRSKPYEAMLPKSVTLIRRLLQQNPIYAMQPQHSRDSHRTLALSITITACEIVTFRRLLTK